LPLYDAAQYCSHEKECLFSQFLFLLWQNSTAMKRVVVLLTGPIGSSSSCPLTGQSDHSPCNLPTECNKFLTIHTSALFLQNIRKYLQDYTVSTDKYNLNNHHDGYFKTYVRHTMVRDNFKMSLISRATYLLHLNHSILPHHLSDVVKVYTG
jgi:hypothetical protein